VGYTHYWYVDKDADRGLMVEAGREMAEVVAAASVPLGNWEGEPGTLPEIDLETGKVWFNGIGDDANETFAWPPDLDHIPESHTDRSRSFNFCKTARMPYDHVVVACLLAAQRVMGDQIEILSDGSLEEFLDRSPYDDPSLQEESARELYSRVFGEPPSVPPRMLEKRNS
jgi:hypothetical protein